MIQNASRKRAYASLLYGEEFVLGIRVLGQSILEASTGTTNADLVALVAGKISDSTLKLLRDDGWIVKQSDIVSNPTAVHPKKFSGVYTKLLLFGEFSEYEQVIFLDADTIVVKSIESLFFCDGFCAVLRHSERFNTGVMAIKTDTALMQDMLTKALVLPSYTGGDQGFLNEYFNTFSNAPMFYPEKERMLSEYGPVNQLYNGAQKPPIEYMGRLPTTYNADLGLFVLNHNRWPFDQDSIRVIHYTLGPIKPWQWWSLWALGQDALHPWIHARNHLQSSGSCVFGTQSFWKGIYLHQDRRNLLGLCIWVVALASGYRQLLSIMAAEKSTCMNLWYLNPSTSAMSKRAQSSLVTMSFKSMKKSSILKAVSIGYCSILLCTLMAFLLIPTQVCPWTGYFMVTAIFILTFPLLNELFWYYSPGPGHKTCGTIWPWLSRSFPLYLAISFLIVYPPFVSLVLFKTIWSSLCGLVLLEIFSLLLCGYICPYTHR